MATRAHAYLNRTMLVLTPELPLFMALNAHLGHIRAQQPVSIRRMRAVALGTLTRLHRRMHNSLALELAAVMAHEAQVFHDQQLWLLGCVGAMAGEASAGLNRGMDHPFGEFLLIMAVIADIAV